MALQGLFAKISLLLLLAVTVCLTIGMATPFWISNSGHTSGLWQSCYYETHAKVTRVCKKLEERADFTDIKSWVKGVRALEIIACLGGVVGLLFLAVYLFKNDGQANLNRIKFVMFLCMLSCILSLVGAILYGSKRANDHFGQNEDYGWSFILTTVSGSVFGLIVLPLLIEIRQARQLGTYESI